MRKLLVTIVSFLILNSLFITHAMAVGGVCPYITDQLDMYKSKERWKAIVKEFDPEMRKHFYPSVLDPWRQGTNILHYHSNVFSLYHKVPKAAERMGIYTLYKADNLKTFIDEIKKSTLISEVTSQKSFGEYLGVGNSTVSKWLNGPDEISYEGQLRLNLLKKYFDDQKPLEAAAAANLVEPTFIRASVIVDNRPLVEPREEATLPLKKRRKKMEDWYKP